MEKNFKVLVEMTAEELDEFRKFLAEKENGKEEVTVSNFSPYELICELMRRSDDNVTKYFRLDPITNRNIDSVEGTITQGYGKIKFRFDSDGGLFL